MAQRVEDQFLNQLMQLEFAVIGFYGEHPDLTDAMVEGVYEELTKRYRAEVTAHEYKAGKLDGLRLELHEILLPQTEMMVGRPANVAAHLRVTPEEMQAILKRLRSSIKTWSKYGRQGYLKYLDSQLSGMGEGLDLDAEE